MNHLAIQIMMGIGLAACCGLRAWLPLFLVGLFGRLGKLPLSDGFHFLSTDAALIVFAVASLAELLGDKIPIVDHFLDLAGTVVRPVAGVIAFAAILTRLDPLAGIALGLIAGGGTTLAVHGGKSVLRAKSTALAPAHMGCGNTVLSFLEDAASTAGVWLAVHAPVLLFALAVAAVVLSIWLVLRLLRSGARLFVRRVDFGPRAGLSGFTSRTHAKPADFEVEESESPPRPDGDGRRSREDQPRKDDGLPRS